MLHGLKTGKYKLKNITYISACLSYTSRQKQAKKLDSITDVCYTFDEVHKNKHKLDMREFSCTEGVAGSLYYTFLYTIEKGSYTILIKFLHRHSNVYTNKKGKPVPFTKKKDMSWAMDIIESAQFVKQPLKG